MLSISLSGDCNDFRQSGDEFNALKPLKNPELHLCNLSEEEAEKEHRVYVSLFL